MPNMFIGKGNLADAPSLKVANGERGEFKVAEMRVFFDRWTRDQETGEPVQNGGFWLPVQVYEAKAEACAKLLRKGARVKVEGELREFTAHDANNNEVTAFQVRADDITLVLSRVDDIQYRAPRDRAEQRERAEA